MYPNIKTALTWIDEDKVMMIIYSDGDHDNDHYDGDGDGDISMLIVDIIMKMIIMNKKY